MWRAEGGVSSGTSLLVGATTFLHNVESSYLDLTRYRRHMSAYSTKLIESQRTQSRRLVCNRSDVRFAATWAEEAKTVFSSKAPIFKPALWAGTGLSSVQAIFRNRDKNGTKDRSIDRLTVAHPNALMSGPQMSIETHCLEWRTDRQTGT